MKGLYAIVGMNHRQSEQFVAALPAGEPLTLIREPTNQYDPNAIQVWARDRHVGYVKATQARTLARHIDANGTPPLDAIAGFSIDAKICVTADRWPMAEVEE